MATNLRSYHVSLLLALLVKCSHAQPTEMPIVEAPFGAPFEGPFDAEFVAPSITGPLLAPYTDDLRQSGFIEWITSIFLPRPTTTTTTVNSLITIPARECSNCTCGSINTYNRIVGGVETEVHEYPWMAMLRTDGAAFYCGAALINDLYVLTAAHCVDGFTAGGITVRLLEHNRKNSSADVIDRNVSTIFMNENYNRQNLDSDIALIRFTEPVQFTDVLRPVCLPEGDNDFAGDTSVVTGWGKLSETGQISDTLQEVEVPVLSQEDCRMSAYGASSITDNMLCAGFKEGAKDACQGDSGGPLHVAFNDSKQYQQVGVVSWGEGCARPDKPGVYARVTRFKEWIAERTLDGCSCSQSADTY